MSPNPKAAPPIREAVRQSIIKAAQRRRAVLDAAIAFVLLEWGEMQELKGTNSASAPAEYMNLHHAVCELKGWKPFGDHPEAEKK